MADVNDADDMLRVVYAVNHAVRAPARAEPVVERRTQPLPNAMRILEQGADDELVRS